MELTTLNPATGQPAIDHIRSAFARGMHVVTANKGPIAHAYADLRDEAQRRGLMFRFEATVMDGAPVFNQVRNNLPGVQVMGFTGQRAVQAEELRLGQQLLQPQAALDAKRLVDFAAGLIFGLRGSIERVTNKVFLLSPANIEVTAEDKARMAERGFFNQS